MIKLVTLLNELGINKPIPRFKSDEELMEYLNSNGKNKFIELVSIEMKIIDNPEWVDVIEGWKINNIVKEEFGVDDNDDDPDVELVLSDGEDNRIHFTLYQASPFIMFQALKRIIEFGPNTIYFKYY